MLAGLAIMLQPGLSESASNLFTGAGSEKSFNIAYVRRILEPEGRLKLFSRV